MVHVPTRLSEEHEVPVRLGPSIKNVPDYGPSTMSRQPYTDPVQFELEQSRQEPDTADSGRHRQFVKIVRVPGLHSREQRVPRNR